MKDFRFRHCLYQFGHRWYRVQFRGLTNSSIGQQKFIDEKTGELSTVYDRTLEKCSSPYPEYIKKLDPDSPAILYRYPGNQKDRYGAAGLCRLLYPTYDPRVKGLHSGSAREPDNRFKEICQIVEASFSDAYLDGTRIEIDPHPLRVPRYHFPVPDQLFGHQTVLHVKQHRDDKGINIKDLGTTRMEYLTSNDVGPLGASEFHAQYIFIPQTLPRTIGKHVIGEFQKAVQQFSPNEYRIAPILYDDRHAKSLMQQVKALTDAVKENNIRAGYALLILPENADKDLHNYLKRHLWPDLQFQCATGRKISSDLSARAHERQRGIRAESEATGQVLLVFSVHGLRYDDRQSHVAVGFEHAITLRGLRGDRCSQQQGRLHLCVSKWPPLFL